METGAVSVLSLIHIFSSRLPLQILTTAATQILFGLAIGAVLAFVVRWVLLHVDFETSGFDTAFVLASAVLAYALPSVIGGNGYLSAYLMGILLSNSPVSYTHLFRFIHTAPFYLPVLVYEPFTIFNTLIL